jgi:shikimate kinase/3-dehydroquinate synthase
MGAGKSTVGERVARSLGWAFVDLDRELEAAFAMTTGEAFRRHGEPAFRAMESRLLRQAVAAPRRVVALGGGTVLDPRNRALLRDCATWVHLDVPLPELLRRLGGAGERERRPLLRDGRDVGTILAERQPAYAEAPQRVDGDAPPGDVATAVLACRPAGPAAGTRPAGSAAPLGPGILHRVPVEVPGSPYEIVVSSDSLEAMAERIASIGRGPLALLSEQNVAPLYGERVESLLRAQGRRVLPVTLPAGERNKEMGPVLDALDHLLAEGWQREAPVVALGGGVLGDMAGLVASLLLRGVPLLQVPTTLLAMVDSSVGGKVGVNHRSGKNLVGAFHQPALVWADLSFLRTLPDRELRAGLAEVAKAALLGDLELLALLESEPDALLARDPALLADCVVRACRQKAAVVAADPREAGLRRILNLGHTLGHAIEAAAGYGRILHGEAVSIGLVGAAELGAAWGISPPSLPARVRRLLGALGLPTSAPALPEMSLSRALIGDKKLSGDAIRWIVLEEPGRARVVERPLTDLPDWLATLRKSGVLAEPPDSEPEPRPAGSER